MDLQRFPQEDLRRLLETDFYFLMSIKQRQSNEAVGHLPVLYTLRGKGIHPHTRTRQHPVCS